MALHRCKCLRDLFGGPQRSIRCGHGLLLLSLLLQLFFLLLALLRRNENCDIPPPLTNLLLKLLLQIYVHWIWYYV